MGAFNFFELMLNSNSSEDATSTKRPPDGGTGSRSKEDPAAIFASLPPGTHVIFWRRSNLIKHAIALHRGAQAQNACHSLFSRGAHMYAGGACNFNTSRIELPAFFGALRNAAMAEMKLTKLQAIAAASPNSLNVVVAVYEAAVRDCDAELGRVFRAVGMGDDDRCSGPGKGVAPSRHASTTPLQAAAAAAAGTHSGAQLQGAMNTSNTNSAARTGETPFHSRKKKKPKKMMVKTTSINLRDSISNFDALEAALADTPCLSGMLHDVASNAFPTYGDGSCQEEIAALVHLSFLQSQLATFLEENNNK